ncbi:condensin II non structural maintenance of chromosomes subunit-domain-containing protein [Tribonema minus]|uniref:Condensin II non structural maintenance of chromosomes subunit-domain-containing protein n=1 Tax=Tribonema minus TaxID=303371 RepID=A0A835YRM8_9STRA|nr:condensin II non structural maintenance of chromosomes subunit-domain-containing protein [Tribonema minus]
MYPPRQTPWTELLHSIEAATAAGAADHANSDLELLALLKRHRARSDEYDLDEVIQALPRKEHERFWAAALALVTPITEGHLYLIDDEEDEEEGSEEGTADEEDAPAAHGAVDKDAVVSISLELMDAITTLAGLFLADKKRAAPPSLLSTMAALHGILLYLQGAEGAALQTAIARACEAWWRAERPGGEHLVACLLPYLLLRALDPAARDADVRRLCDARGALLLLDWEDADAEGTRALLLRAFLAPAFLRGDAGRRFLASVFGLHPAFAARIHAVVSAQLPRARRAVLAAYGEVYFRAWRGADGGGGSGGGGGGGGVYAAEIEGACMQPLMAAAAHAAAPAAAAAARGVLDAFHAQRRQKGVDAALLRLYDPILWRALRVANPVVRAQAAALLARAFPLQDPDGPAAAAEATLQHGPAAAAEATLQRQFDALSAIMQDFDLCVPINHGPAAAAEATLQRQFDALSALMQDGDPRVRAAAARAVCAVVGDWWEAIPMATTRALLTRVITKALLTRVITKHSTMPLAVDAASVLLAADAASPLVRIAALEGLTALLDCALSHSFLAADAASPLVRIAALEGLTALLDCALSHSALKALLPALRNTLHDANPRARRAFVALLLRVRSVRAIRFYHVAPVDALLAQLEVDDGDAPPVARALAELLANSYYPQGAGVTGEEQVGRMLTMVQQNYGAARAFCRHLRAHVGAGAVTKMAVMLFKAVQVAAAAALSKGESKAAALRNGESALNKRGGAKGVGGAKQRGGVAAKGRKRTASPPPAGGSEGGGESDGGGDSDRENAVAAAPTVNIDTALSARLLTLCVDLWESIGSDLSTNPALQPCQELLSATVDGRALTLLLTRLEGNADARAALLRMAGLMGAAALPELLEAMVGQLLSLRGDAPVATWGPIIDTLCTWGEQRHLVAVLIHALSAGLKPGGGGSSGGGGAPALPVRLALRALGFVLSGGGGRAAVAAARDELVRELRSLARLCAALGGAVAAANARIAAAAAQGTSGSGGGSIGSSGVGGGAPDELVVEALEALGRLHLHAAAAAVAAAASDDDQAAAAAAEAPLELAPGARELALWATEKLVPAAARGDAFAAAALRPIVALAAEWVALGSGLAEIGLRAQSWGEGLLAGLPPPSPPPIAAAAAAASDDDDDEGDDEGGDDAAAAAALRPLVPALCRLAYQLLVAEAQGAHSPDALWRAVLPFAGSGGSSGGGDAAAAAAAAVDKLLAVAAYLHARRNTPEALVARVLPFVCASAAVATDAAPADGDLTAVVARAPAAAAALRRSRIGRSRAALTPAAAAALAPLLKSAPVARALAAAAREGAAGSGRASAAMVHVLRAVVASAPAAAAAAAGAAVAQQLLGNGDGDEAAVARRALLKALRAAAAAQQEGEERGGKEGGVAAGSEAGRKLLEAVATEYASRMSVTGGVRPKALKGIALARLRSALSAALHMAYSGRVMTRMAESRGGGHVEEDVGEDPEMPFGGGGV